MKEKISQLAKEKFEYDKPKLIFSEERLQVAAVVSEKTECSIQITNTMGRPMKGVVYSSDERLRFEHNTFVGEEASLTASYDASGEESTDTAKMATITVVSNYGTYELPVEINLEAPYIEAGKERIRTMEDFAAVARQDWKKALAVFKTQEFCQLLVTDLNERNLYDGLLKSQSLDQAMEEFLVAAGKKKKVLLSLETEEKQYDDVDASISDSLVIKAEEWGYIDGTITTDSDFIVLEQETLAREDFTDGSCAIPFTIDYGRVLGHKEAGTITITTSAQVLQYRLTVMKTNVQQQKVTESYSFLRRKYEAKLVECYMEFRLNHLSMEEYGEALEETIHKLQKVDPSVAGNLWMAHRYMITGEKDKLDRIMKMFAGSEHDLLEESLDYYLAYRYLDVLYTKDAENIEETVKLFHSYLETERKDWRLLWYLLYIDKSYEEDQKKRLEAILSMLEDGVTSPVLYYEAAFTYNKEPELLERLGRKERQIMHWAIRHRLIGSELAKQFVTLASKLRKQDKLLMQDLMTVYEYRESTECLQSILRMLITGQMADPCYFKWYERGVRKNIRITELYEYYMYSMKEDDQVVIEEAALSYFLYNNHLPEAKKAFLYAYILKHKEENAPVYRTYLPQMESFTRKMALKGALNTSLVSLYEKFITPESVDEELAKALPQILFRYELVCKNKKNGSILVRQKELKDERIFGMDDGKGFLAMATSDAVLLLQDLKKNRSLGTGTYTLNRPFYKEELIKGCYELNKGNLLLLLDHRQKLLEAGGPEEELFEVTARLLESEEVSREFQSSIMVSMMKQAGHLGELNKQKEYLKEIDLLRIEKEDRKTVVEALIEYGEYEKAFKMVKLYGYDDMETDHLHALVDHMLKAHIATQQASAANHYLIAMCDLLYRKGTADEAILSYLSEHYEGVTKDLYQRYQDFEQAGTDTLLLQERLLGQMLFSEDGLEDSKSVFEEYYKVSSNKMLIRAYLNYMAYRFVRFDEPVDETLCEMMKRESFYHESKVSMLALLKFFQHKKDLTEEETKLIDYNLHKFIKEGIVLPFFKEYRDRIQLPNTVTDRTYVEYQGAPESKVAIYYKREGQDEMSEAVMVNMFEGIFVQDFVLFYGETLDYYVAEETALKEQIKGQMESITMSGVPEEPNNRFDELNLMLEALKQKDDEALQEQLMQYAIEDYITSSLFTPL